MLIAVTRSQVDKRTWSPHRVFFLYDYRRPETHATPPGWPLNQQALNISAHGSHVSRISKYTLRKFLSFGLDMDLLKNALTDGLIPHCPFFAKFSLLSFSSFIICNSYYPLPCLLYLWHFFCSSLREQLKAEAGGSSETSVHYVRQFRLLTTLSATPPKQNIPSVIQTSCRGADVSVPYCV